MEKRLELQEKLENILGSSEVYFQPPASVRMTYPCIVFDRSNIDVKYANNRLYLYKNRYMVTVITRDPDDRTPLKILESFQLCSYDRDFIANNLYHTVLSVYY